MTEEIIIDKEDKTKKHRNNEIDCLHFGCRKGESGNVLFWCDFYDDHCDNYTGCYYRKYLRLEQENKELKEEIQFHNKENSNLLAERNALQIGYDEIREVRERYRTALEEIREIAENAKEGRYATKSEDYTEGMHTIGCYVLDRINEVLNENTEN